jgi:hypothetical protein
MPSIFLPICNKIIIIVSFNDYQLIILDFVFLLRIDGGEIVIAKFNYTSQENHELTINKNERLILLDDTCLWWKVKRVDSDETG